MTMPTTFPLRLATLEHDGRTYYLGRVRVQAEPLGVATGWVVGVIRTDGRKVAEILGADEVIHWLGEKLAPWANEVMLTWTAEDN